MGGTAAAPRTVTVTVRPFIWLLGLAPLLAGCTLEMRVEHQLLCRTNEMRWVRETLYFGATRVHGGEVDAAQWTDFEKSVLLERFPRGFTVFTGKGHWRDDSGVAFDEAVRVVTIDHADDVSGNAAVRRVISDYRVRFDQEAVLHERSAACVSLKDGD